MRPSVWRGRRRCRGSRTRARRYRSTGSGTWTEPGRNLDGKQVQRWSEKLGARLTAERDREVLGLQEGRHPPDLPSDPQLLVIEVDGGRWQGREENPDTRSRWHEDKVCAIATYLPGDGKEKDRPAASAHDLHRDGARRRRVRRDVPAGGRASRAAPGGAGHRSGRRRQLDRPAAGTPVPWLRANRRLATRAGTPLRLRPGRRDGRRLAAASGDGQAGWKACCGMAR